MSSQPKPTPEDVAADWLARRDSGLTPAEERALADWLAAAPEHAEAWAEAESLWQALDAARTQGLAEGMVSELTARERRRRWRVQLGWAAGLAAAAAVAVLFFVQSTAQPAGPEQSKSSAVAFIRPERRVLEDGSVVELAKGSEISVSYSAERRDVRLVQGKALFIVAKNPARPFIVAGNGVVVRAVGTAFAVQLADDVVDVLVTEGRVAVDRPAVASTAAAGDPVFVSAGGRLLVPMSGSEALHAEFIPPAELASRLAWRGAQLELSGARLQEAVDVINRETGARITVADVTLAGVRLSGIFAADKAEDFVRMLEQNPEINLVAERHTDEIVLRSR